MRGGRIQKLGCALLPNTSPNRVSTLYARPMLAIVSTTYKVDKCTLQYKYGMVRYGTVRYNTFGKVE